MSHPTPSTAEAFRAAVLAGDIEAVEPLLAPDVVFRSPAVHTPYEGKQATLAILRAVVTVLEDFRYTRSFAEEDGSGHLLVFEASVGGRDVEGVDVLRFDAAGLIVDFRVLVRPLRGLEALVAAMATALQPDG